MLAHDRPPHCGACLLRYWQVRSSRAGKPSTWRFSLEQAGTGERRAFPDLEALLAYLVRELGRESAGPASAGATHSPRPARRTNQAKHSEEKGDPS